VEDQYNTECAETSNEESKLSYNTVYKESFEKKGFSETLDTKNNNLRVPTYNADYATDVPITFYSHELMTQDRPGFPLTFVQSNNPFKKNW